MKKRPYHYKFILILILIVLLNIGAIIWFNNMVFNELEVSAKTTLERIATEEKNIMSVVIESNDQNIQSIVDLLPHIDNDPATLYNYMDVWLERFNISTLYITDINGRGISSASDYVVDISSNPYFHSAFDGETALTEVYMSQSTGGYVIATVAPVFYEGTVQAVVIAEYDIAYFTSILHGAGDNSGNSMIVDSDGDILVHSYPFDISFENFQNAEFEGGRSYTSVLADFANLNSGEVNFIIGGERKFGIYLPLNIDDWSLFFEISESEINASADSITFSMIVVSLSLFIAFSFLLIYILYTRRASLKEIEEVAFYDKLTGLANLVKFKQDLEKIVSQKDFDSQRYVLVKIDMADFKAINEIYGFDIGNEVLCKVADTLRSIQGNNVHCARIGTDEFILFAESSTVDEFLSSDHFSRPLKLAIPTIKKHIFNFRYGRYYLEPNEKSADEMVSKVGMAHSFAKAQSNSSTMWDYDDKFKQHLIYLTELTNKMEDALAHYEFKLYLQPKYRLSDERIVGAEALVRWIEPGGTMVFPNDFIPLFEKNKFIIQLDKYMFAQACRFLAKCQNSSMLTVPISVNFSRLHFKNPNFVQEIKDIANKYKVPLSYLEIELTETILLENNDTLKDTLVQLRKEGFTVSIDDFGSGYSSLGMLKEYKVDTIKLDRSFFTGQDQDDDGRVVVEGVVDLVKNLGSVVVAEGIETKEQVDFLKSVGCYSVQGYYYAKPMPTTDFEELVSL